MTKEQKSQIIEEISQDLANYSHVYVTDISGFTVSTVNQLRKLFFSKDVKLKVVKNTLLKRAMDQSEKDYSELYETLNGPTAVMLCNTGNVPAKLIKQYADKNKKNPDAKPALKAAFVEGTTYVGKEQLDFLCNIKSKNELIADLVALLQSPAKNVLSALQSGGSTIHGVLTTLGERAE